MKYLHILLEIVSNFFRWRANKSDPNAKYEADMVKWRKEIGALTKVYNDAESAYDEYVAKFKGSGSVPLTDPELVRLERVWDEAATACSNYVRRQPQRPTNRP